MRTNEFPAELVNTVEEGDTLWAMDRLPDGCVDLVVTSPPYGVGKFYEQGKKQKPEPLWHTIWLWYQSFKRFQRVVKPGGYVMWNFGDNANGKRILHTEVLSTIPMSPWVWAIGLKTGFELQATRIWRKSFAPMAKPFFMNHSPRPVFDYEHLWAWRKPDGTGKEIVNEHKIGRRGVWDTSPAGMAQMGMDYQGGVKVTHGAAFPLAIPAWAITVYSQPGDLVMDNFLGTGTTALAALQLGRRYYGIELFPEWVQFSKERIANES